MSSDAISSTLHRVAINISDTGPHHSWALDHLLSLPNFPLRNVSHLSIKRLSDHQDAVVEEALALRTLPQDILGWLCNSGSYLEELECDWWSWTTDDLKAVFEKCSLLQVSLLSTRTTATRLSSFSLRAHTSASMHLS